MDINEKANIIIVDDDPVKSENIRSIISDCNENIMLFNNGKSVLRFLLTNEASVILLDVNMPEMDGFETASLIRKRKQNEFTPIIFITAYSRDAIEVTKGYSLGAVDYLFTPVVPGILRAKVKVFIDLFKMNQLIRRNSMRIESLNDMLEKQKYLLEESNKQLEAFSYSVSHDLKAPLRGIIGYSSELTKKHGSVLSERGVFCVDQISTASKQLNAMIDDLLSYSRMGIESIGKHKINMKNFIENIIKQEQFKRDGESIILSLHLADTEVYCWETGMRLAFNNLIDNAYKYSKNSKPSKISIVTSISNNEFVFQISDNGIGFDMTYHGRMFELFHRLENAREFEGTGAGLAIVKKIIERHNGRIWAESEIGKGAKITFTVPLTEHES